MNTDTLETLEYICEVVSVFIYFFISPEIKAQYCLYEVGLLLSFSIIFLQIQLRKEYTQRNSFSFTIFKTRIIIHKPYAILSAMLAGSTMLYEMNSENYIYYIMFVISQLLIAKFEIKKL